MGAVTAIEWTDHTFNPWWGCVKISPACDNCYAADQAKRYGHDVWGKDAPRRELSDAHWRQPLKWDRAAAEAGRPALVFCASMADVFEARDDLDPLRARLWELVVSTPHLIWLLLTKRPEQVLRRAPAAWLAHKIGAGAPLSTWPSNVWVGTTVENQHYADLRIPRLLDVPAPVRFLSCEPLLGPVDLVPWLPPFLGEDPSPLGWVNWVIVGGESGRSARPTSASWVRRLRDDCAEAETPFFFKQWGEWAPDHDGSGIDPDESMTRVGKKAAGILLDGQVHQAWPAAAGDRSGTAVAL